MSERTELPTVERAERCETCRFARSLVGEKELRWEDTGEPMSLKEYEEATCDDTIVCRRYPTEVDKMHDDWCGEWKAKGGN